MRRGVHVLEVDDVEEGRLIPGHMSEGIDVEGVIEGQEGDGVVENAEVGGSVCIFDRGLGLEAGAPIEVGQIYKLTPLGLNLHCFILFNSPQINIQNYHSANSSS